MIESVDTKRVNATPVRVGREWVDDSFERRRFKRLFQPWSKRCRLYEILLNNFSTTGRCPPPPLPAALLFLARKNSSASAMSAESATAILRSQASHLIPYLFYVSIVLLFLSIFFLLFGFQENVKLPEEKSDTMIEFEVLVVSTIPNSFFSPFIFHGVSEQPCRALYGRTVYWL